jgi:DnaJ-class molecular chaperone
MGVEIEGSRLVNDNDECPYCNGIGKVNGPGAPDCPQCRGTGVMGVFLRSYPQNEAKISGESHNLLYK